jgi:hypothetical protein
MRFALCALQIVEGGGETDDAMEMFKLWLYFWSRYNA